MITRCSFRHRHLIASLRGLSIVSWSTISQDAATWKGINSRKSFGLNWAQFLGSIQVTEICLEVATYDSVWLKGPLPK